jgi:uncharacterized protein
MPVTVTPLGMRCNLQCGYCYEDPLRDAGNFGTPYDIELIKAAISRESSDAEPFLLFGGEPLLLPKDTLEELCAWGFERSGRTSIQTNGNLIDKDHIVLFKKYKVGVGISIDGPGALNDARWNQNLEKTRACTRRTETAISLLCENGLMPSLIVTLHRLNASGENLDLLMKWFRELSVLGVSRIGLHLLEVENEMMRTRYLLSDDECITALSKLRMLRAELPAVSFSLLEDLDSLMTGKDSRVRCIWQACDPYTTPAVRGIGGQGERTKCSRVNKEGVDFLPSDRHSFERYIALYRTPYEAGGCQGCRFFLSCRGQCPGTAIGGDWRNRSEQCHTWMRTFEAIEKDLADSGTTPISLSSERVQLEARLVNSWENGRNLPVESIVRSGQSEKFSENWSTTPEKTSTISARIGLSNNLRGTNTRLFTDNLPFHLHAFSRIVWTSETARAAWEAAFNKVRTAIVYAECMSISTGFREAGLFQLSSRELKAMEPLWLSRDLAWEQLNDSDDFHSIFLESVRISGIEPRKCFVVGRPETLLRFSAMSSAHDYFSAADLLGYPSCCAAALQAIKKEHICRDTTWAIAVHNAPERVESREVKISIPAATNIFLRKAGVRALAHHPCSFHCTFSSRIAEELKKIVVNELREGADAYQLLETILGWPVEWSALHGIAEVRSPVLKLCYQTDATAGRYVIRYAGKSYPSEGAHGLTFPYLHEHPSEMFKILH